MPSLDAFNQHSNQIKTIGHYVVCNTGRHTPYADTKGFPSPQQNYINLKSNTICHRHQAESMEKKCVKQSTCLPLFKDIIQGWERRSICFQNNGDVNIRFWFRGFIHWCINILLHKDHHHRIYFPSGVGPYYLNCCTTWPIIFTFASSAFRFYDKKM